MKKEEVRTESITKLKHGLLQLLKAKSYKDTTLSNYESVYSMLEYFMHENNINNYSPCIGTSFIAHYNLNRNLGISRKSAVITIIDRLNDYFNGVDFILQKKQILETTPNVYEALLTAYLLDCKKKGNKDTTIINKKSHCTKFLINLFELGCQELCDWDTTFICKACVKVQNKYAWAIIRMFLKYLSESNLLPADYSTLVPHFRIPRIIPTVYSEEEILMFESVIDRSTLIGKRDYAMILLATRLGIRSGDIAKLTFDELDFTHNTIHIVQEKTGQPIELPMLLEIKEALNDYIKNSRPDIGTNDVFLRIYAPHEKISTSVIRFATTKYLNKAEINILDKKHGPHAFRSSLASSMINDDFKYEIVQSILGHKDPNAINHYARLDIERLREYSIEVPEPKGIFKKLLEGGIVL